MPLLLKYALTAAIVIAIGELARRSTTAAALLASLPLTSLLAMIWLYHDTGDAQQVAALAGQIFWLVIPSLALFLALPALIRAGQPFYLSLVLSCGITVLAYSALLWVQRHHGLAV